MVFRVLLLLVSSLVALHLGRLSASESQIPDSKEYVLTLDHSNFSDTISNHDFILVEFYAPWCGHCKKLAPEYEKAASILSKHDPPVSLAKVDADNEANKELVSSYGIRGFPTLIILRNGGKVVQDYKGLRDADGIVTDLKKQSGPASLEIKCAENAISLIGHNKVVIVGIFPKFSGEEYANFTTVAEKLRSDYEFGHTLEARLLPRGDSSVVGPIIRLFKPFDELFVDFQDFHVEAIEKFVEEAGLPTVTVYDHDHYPFVMKLYRNKNAKAMLFLNFTEEVDVYLKKYYEIAKEYKGKAIDFLIGSVQDTQSTFEFFGVKEDQVPLFLIQTYDRKKYLKSKVEPEQIAPWIKDFEEGKLFPFKKSEPIPETNDEPVKVVVAETLEDLVLNSGKNVLLEFYAPWCGHCKKLAPILDEIAVSFENDSNVVIAKLDATANDVGVDAFSVQGYPTLYFISSSGKIVQYDGDRSKEDITEFIQKNREQAPQTAEHASLHEEL